MKVPFIDLSRQHEPIKKELLKTFENVLDSNQFILGEEVKKFEEEVASYVGTKYAIGVSNCTNALLLSLRALDVGRGDEVITTPFTFIATAEVIAILGAKPVFCDIGPKTLNINPNKIPELISNKTKAILPVHLYGQSADMDKIMQIAEENNLNVIEDMAQAIGAKYKGKKVGTFGDTSCISFFPTKNLSALGDAGMILTNNEELDNKLRAFRVHGASKKYYHDVLGYNDRLDTIQAAFLRVKLKYLDEWNEGRRQIAHKYDVGLKDIVQIPYVEPDNVTIYHQYTIRTPKRDELKEFLTEKAIGTAIHYPLPLHFQKAFKYLGYKEGDLPEAEKATKEVLSLPIHHTLTDGEVNYVISTIRSFFGKS
ncbi:DegT/DnrJ/EryC1/StrS family aminotransferase [candidate division WOR-3 bacterium]|nr:DegT/DnrJ/EryC1/StrS family aminotransferase [candidate division WOR-3 bacterium]